MIRYIDFYHEFGDSRTRYQHYSDTDPFTITEYAPGESYGKPPVSIKQVTEEEFIARIAGALGCPAGV